jgi:hypothetical protein
MRFFSSLNFTEAKAGMSHGNGAGPFIGPSTGPPEVKICDVPNYKYQIALTNTDIAYQALMIYTIPQKKTQQKLYESR